MKFISNKRDIIELREKENNNQEPLFYQVWMHRDDFTPREFVVTVLEIIFNMDRVQAATVMMEARAKGIAACGRYTKDVALSLLTKAEEYTRKHEQPLMYSAEAE